MKVEYNIQLIFSSLKKKKRKNTLTILTTQRKLRLISYIQYKPVVYPNEQQELLPEYLYENEGYAIMLL